MSSFEEWLYSNENNPALPSTDERNILGECPEEDDVYDWVKEILSRIFPPKSLIIMLERRLLLLKVLREYDTSPR